MSGECFKFVISILFSTKVNGIKIIVVTVSVCVPGAVDLLLKHMTYILLAL